LAAIQLTGNFPQSVLVTRFEVLFANRQEGSCTWYKVMVKHCFKSKYRVLPCLPNSNSPAEGRVNGNEDLTSSRRSWVVSSSLPLLELLPDIPVIWDSNSLWSIARNFSNRLL